MPQGLSEIITATGDLSERDMTLSWRWLWCHLSGRPRLMFRSTILVTELLSVSVPPIPMVNIYSLPFLSASRFPLPPGFQQFLIVVSNTALGSRSGLPLPVTNCATFANVLKHPVPHQVWWFPLAFPKKATGMQSLWLYAFSLCITESGSVHDPLWLALNLGPCELSVHVPATGLVFFSSWKIEVELQ